MTYWDRMLEHEEGPPPDREYFYPERALDYRIEDSWEVKDLRSDSWRKLSGRKSYSLKYLKDKMEKGLLRVPALHPNDLGMWGWQEIESFRYTLDDRWFLAFRSWDVSAVLWLRDDTDRLLAFIPLQLKTYSDMEFVIRKIIPEWEIFMELK